MTVMVDELRVYPNAKGIFSKGSSHLTASTEDELHAFAQALGMKRSWFQDHRVIAHYDLTPRRYWAALAAKAVFVPMKDQIRALHRSKP